MHFPQYHAYHNLRLDENILMVVHPKLPDNRGYDLSMDKAFVLVHLPKARDTYNFKVISGKKMVWWKTELMEALAVMGKEVKNVAH